MLAQRCQEILLCVVVVFIASCQADVIRPEAYDDPNIPSLAEWGTPGWTDTYQSGKRCVEYVMADGEKNFCCTKKQKPCPDKDYKNGWNNYLCDRCDFDWRWTCGCKNTHKFPAMGYYNIPHFGRKKMQLRSAERIGLAVIGNLVRCVTGIIKGLATAIFRFSFEMPQSCCSVPILNNLVGSCLDESPAYPDNSGGPPPEPQPEPPVNVPPRPTGPVGPMGPMGPPDERRPYRPGRSYEGRGYYGGDE